MFQFVVTDGGSFREPLDKDCGLIISWWASSPLLAGCE